MWTLLALTIVTVGGQRLVKFYERHLEAQIGASMADDKVFPHVAGHDRNSAR